MGNNFADYTRCLDLHYKNNIGDEFINPSIITKGSTIKDNDGVLFVDFRPELMSEFISSFVDDSFNMFNIKNFKNVKYSCLYSVNGKIDCAFSSESVINTFGSYLAGLDFRQVRIAETCRYPHVTYYFDGLEEFNDKNLYKILVPSPKVPRFDSKPEMSIADVTTSALQAMDDDFDFILVNFANADMVGHTGNIASIVRALEACDVCIGKLLEKANENFYDLVIVSDHGNVEMMKNDDGTYEMLDGQQRTISICDWLDNGYSIFANPASPTTPYYAHTSKEITNKVLEYKLMIYICKGTDTEKLDWCLLPKQKYRI